MAYNFVASLLSGLLSQAGQDDENQNQANLAAPLIRSDNSHLSSMMPVQFNAAPGRYTADYQYGAPVAGGAAASEEGGDDFWKKALAGGMNAIEGAAGAVGSIDKRLTDVRYPNRPMGQFAPNLNPGLVGVEQLLRMIAASGSR